MKPHPRRALAKEGHLGLLLGEVLAPLRESPSYRVLLTATLTAILGRWMLLLGAQWFLVEIGPGMVSLVPTVLSAPVVVLALVAGAWADRWDRRRMIMLTYLALTVTGALLAVMATAEILLPRAVLVLMFIMGCWFAINMPPTQSVQTEVVPPQHLHQAATWTAVGANIGRAVGPAVGGMIVVLSGVGGVFTAATVLFLFALLGSMRIRGLRPSDATGEGLPAALQAGRRYVRSSPSTLRVLIWVFVFVSINAGLWALLPTIAEGPLSLGADGYGLLLGAVGGGAAIGAVTMPLAKRRFSSNRLLVVSVVAVGITTVGVSMLTSALLVGALMLPLGAAYITIIAVFNSTLQLMLPAWVRARGLAIFIVVFHAAMSLGSAGWGALAEWVGASEALLVTGISMVASVALSWWVRFPEVSVAEEEGSPTGWTEPQPIADVPPTAGPVTVTSVYRVHDRDREEYLRIMELVGAARRRAGAFRHELLHDVEHPDTYVEIYVVPTWGEYLRQRVERLTPSERQLEAQARELISDVVLERHWIPAERVSVGRLRSKAGFSRLDEDRP